MGSAMSLSRYTVVQLNKKDVPAVVSEIPFVESTVREAIDKNFEKLGYKGRKVKDYYVYSGVMLKELDNNPHDIYVMVDRKSRSEKEVSIAAQEEVIKKNTKKIDDLVEDSVSLQKKMKKLTDEISHNSLDLTNQKVENERQRQILETLKNRRRISN